VILSNVEIQKALDEGRLVIEPQPQPTKPELGKYCPYDTHSVDLRLHKEITVPKGGPFVYDLMESGSLAELISKHSEKFTLRENQPFHLKPNQFILGRTLERIRLPITKGLPYLAARIEGKSSRARCGVLVHFTAPTVHPGWEGPLTLEIINLGPTKFALHPEMPIAQLIVEQIFGSLTPNPSQFQNQTTPEGLR
jgi:dCTP deaminase